MEFQHSQSDGHGSTLRRSTPLKVVIVYESAAAKDRATHFSSQPGAEALAERALRVDQWPFAILGERDTRNAAASAAATADLVILSLDGQNTLPLEVQQWVELWTWLIDQRRPALVALFVAQHPESARLQTFLRRSVLNKNLFFLPIMSPTLPEQQPNSDFCCGTTRSSQPAQENKRMPISLKHLLGRKLAALDGNIGHVADFYFEDQRWAIRYLVADTGSWLASRLVLLSPFSFGNIDQSGGCLPIRMTLQQIEDSPAIELHKPISRRYEEAYHAYYGLTRYWNEGGVRGGVAGLQADASSDPRSFAQANIDSQPA